MVWLFVGIGVVAPNWAAAQSAADKATARQLATDGIQLFRQDRFADALDKLERAESLFDAPVHLLYIARCQAKLNRLVEAAETYRRLIRVELSAQAPQTFKDAVADGQKELPSLEPKVPSLRVEVVPATAKELRLTIDGESISTAVLGVDRPINPGAHVVEVSAKGQSPISRRVDVPISSKQVVKLELPAASAVASTPDTTAPNATTASPGATTTKDQPTGAQNQKVDAGRTDGAAKEESQRMKIIAGVDLTGVLPLVGKIDSQNSAQTGTGEADDRAISGRFGIGGGLELRAGLAIPVSKIAITPLLFVGANSHSAGPLYKTSADRSFGLANSVDSVLTAKPVSVSLGIGARIDSAPQQPLDLGVFGELGFVARQQYTTNGTWTVTQSGGSCEFIEEFTGWGFRTRGGVMMPVSRVLTLVGAAGVTFANISSAGLKEKSCTPPELANEFGVKEKADVPSDSRQYHAVIGLSLGAEFGIRVGH